MTDTIVLIHSGDKNRWVWPYWYAYWRRNWTPHPQLDVVWLGETRTPDFPNIRREITGHRDWSNGLKRYLEKCPARNILYTMEDFFLIQPGMPIKILELSSRMTREKISLIKLSNNRHTAAAVAAYTGIDELIPCDNRQWLLCSCMPSLWERDVMRRVLVPGETGPSFEKRGTRRLRAMCCDCRIFIKEPVFNFRHIIRQGKVYETAKRFVSAVDEGKI